MGGERKNGLIHKGDAAFRPKPAAAAVQGMLRVPEGMRLVPATLQIRLPEPHSEDAFQRLAPFGL